MLRALDRLRHQDETLLRGRRRGDGFGRFELRSLGRFTRGLLCGSDGSLCSDAFGFPLLRLDRSTLGFVREAHSSRGSVSGFPGTVLGGLARAGRLGDSLLARVLFRDHLPLRAVRTWLRARLFDTESARDLVQFRFAVRGASQRLFAGKDHRAIASALVQSVLQRFDERSSRGVGSGLRQENARRGGESQWSHDFALFVEPAVVVMDLSKMTTETVSLIFSLPML